MKCSLIETCISSAKYQKIVTWHVCDNLMNELEHQRHTALNREIYKKRKQTIERVFANAKKACAGRNIENLKKLPRTQHLRLLP
ncbi:transposase [Enterococcus faecium]|uniref:transposase n=1 Tax=Enterococcus faecium TaxID=1352 RepID=UPI003EB9E38C